MRQMIGLEHDQISDMLLKSLNQQLMWLIEKIARLLIGENGEYLRFFFGKKKKKEIAVDEWVGAWRGREKST